MGKRHVQTAARRYPDEQSACEKVFRILASATSNERDAKELATVLLGVDKDVEQLDLT